MFAFGCFCGIFCSLLNSVSGNTPDSVFLFACFRQPETSFTGRVENCKYNTRKGNSSRRLTAVVEARPPISGHSITNCEVSKMEQQQFPAVFHGEINNQAQLLCNARELHSFLQSKQDFSTWIKNRIKKYGFVESKDFSTILWKTPDDNIGRPQIEYHITLDMAKELAMVENNEMGRKIRRYFIECENKIRQVTVPQELLHKKDKQISALIEIIHEIEDDNVRAWNFLPLNPEQRNFIRLIVEHKSKMEGLTTGQIFSSIWKEFGCSYVDCKTWQFAQLCEFLGYQPLKEENIPLMKKEHNFFNLPERLAEIGLTYTYAIANCC